MIYINLHKNVQFLNFISLNLNLLAIALITRVEVIVTDLLIFMPKFYIWYQISTVLHISQSNSLKLTLLVFSVPNDMYQLCKSHGNKMLFECDFSLLIYGRQRHTYIFCHKKISQKTYLTKRRSLCRIQVELSLLGYLKAHCQV